MNRVLIIAATAAVLLSPLVATGQDRGGWGHGGGSYQRYNMADRDRGGRGRGEGRGESRGGRGDRSGYEPRGDYEDRGERGGPRGEPRGGPYGSPYGRGPRGMPPPYQAAPTPRGGERSWRRGEYLPPAYRGGVVRDPGRYRLRQPPPGYDWVGVGPDIYLTQRSSGMVLDAIPDGF